MNPKSHKKKTEGSGPGHPSGHEEDER